jgi:hypothetical protein
VFQGERKSTFKVKIRAKNGERIRNTKFAIITIMRGTNKDKRKRRKNINFLIELEADRSEINRVKEWAQSDIWREAPLEERERERERESGEKCVGGGNACKTDCHERPRLMRI